MPQFLIRRGKIAKDGKIYREGDRIEFQPGEISRLPGGMVDPIPEPGPIPKKPDQVSRDEMEETPSPVPPVPEKSRPGPKPKDKKRE